MPTGNLEPVRDLLDVRDVVEAYLALLSAARRARPTTSRGGEGVSLAELFRRLGRADRASTAAPVPDPRWSRIATSRISSATRASSGATTGWAPAVHSGQTLRRHDDAEAH